MNPLEDKNLKMTTVVGVSDIPNFSLVTCPVCRTPQDGITGVGTEDGEPILPHENALCVCGSCGAVNRFNKGEFKKGQCSLREAEPGWENEVPEGFMPIIEGLRGLYKKKNPDAIFYTPKQCAKDVFKRE